LEREMIKMKDLIQEGRTIQETFKKIVSESNYQNNGQPINSKEWIVFEPNIGDYFISDMGGKHYVEIFIVISYEKSTRFSKPDYLCKTYRYVGKPDGTTLKYNEDRTLWLSDLCSFGLTHLDKKLTKPAGTLEPAILSIVKIKGNVKLSDMSR
jgi:hypothetical protein